MRNDKENIIIDLTFDFAVEIMDFADELISLQKFAVANQLIKSGTSIGANVREAQNAESKSDFIHKLKVAAKEADETEYWLLLCQKAKNYRSDEKLLTEIRVIIKVISKIISTSKKSIKGNLTI